MNYEEVLGKFLQSTLDTAKKVGEFAVAQLPELVQQALNWYFAYGLIQFVSGIAWRSSPSSPTLRCSKAH